ncbi:HNH endonuclease [Natrialbaceae archaeon A-CW2]|uniref:HNH endonuclease n=1 Tax=Natronosalvus amylolyticus TaxID=2961994 RepID=UPI0020C9D321|nr:HNH endonuclease [Natronosalvus amylolyticus]
MIWFDGTGRTGAVQPAGAFLTHQRDRYVVDSDAREWHADREAVFERDEYTCRHCGGGREPGDLRVAAVGDIPVQGTVHESSLVTLCDDCYGSIKRPESGIDSSAALFETIRDVTKHQSEAISAVASVGSLATTIPASLEDGEHPEYVDARLDALVVLESVDATLANVEDVADGDAIGPIAPSSAGSDLASRLEAFCTTASTLQDQLRQVLEQAELVIVGLGRCHGCFSPLDPTDQTETTCSTCHRTIPVMDDWRDSDGSVRFDDLYGTINASLQASSRTTTTLTTRTQAVGQLLVGEAKSSSDNGVGRD